MSYCGCCGPWKKLPSISSKVIQQDQEMTQRQLPVMYARTVNSEPEVAVKFFSPWGQNHKMSNKILLRICVCLNLQLSLWHVKQLIGTSWHQDQYNFHALANCRMFEGFAIICIASSASLLLVGSVDNHCWRICIQPESQDCSCCPLPTHGREFHSDLSHPSHCQRKEPPSQSRMVLFNLKIQTGGKMLDFLFPPELSVTFIALDQGSHSYLGA